MQISFPPSNIQKVIFPQITATIERKKTKKMLSMILHIYP